MATKNRTTRLRLETLESREVPNAAVASDFDRLRVDTSSAGVDRILVKFADSQPIATTLASGYESLGSGMFQVNLVDGVNVDQALNHYRGLAGVAFAERDYLVSLTATPNDVQFTSLWGLHNTGQSGGRVDADIDAVEAWNYNTGSGNFIVAVIDSGVDYTHPDLAANMWVNTREIAGNGLDDDGNGYVDDRHGYDFYNRDGDPMDDNGHGTHVAGTIGAVGNNGVGVTGVNWRVKIMALKFLNASGSGFLSDAVRALNYAVANGARVSNNSYGGSGSDPALATAISSARSAGHIFVAAAGNDGRNIDVTPSYPASYTSDNMLTVAALDRSDNLASYSNYGAVAVDLGAPGSSIYSTLPGNRYGTYSGTSMAAPHVAGAAALIWDAHPDWTYQQVIQAMTRTTDSVAALAAKTATGGRLNVDRAIRYGTTPPPADTTGAAVTSAFFTGSTATSFTRVRVTFSEAINASSLTAADITLTNPAGQSIAVSSITAVSGSNNTQFDVNFAVQTTAGTYRITLGPDVRDVAGNQMDQNRNGVSGEATADRYAGTGTITAPVTGRTFHSANVGQTIPDLGRVASTLTVAENLTIRDLNVRLNITHTFDNDLRITLVGPDGTQVILSNRRGGSGDNFNSTNFDDEATTKISQGLAPFSGSFKPDQALTAFDGKNARGTWQLIVEDLARQDIGRLNSWSITIETASTGAGARSLMESTGGSLPSNSPASSDLVSPPVNADLPPSPNDPQSHRVNRANAVAARRRIDRGAGMSMNSSSTSSATNDSGGFRSLRFASNLDGWNAIGSNAWILE